MEILKTNELIKIDNPNPGERYRLDLVTGEQMASKLGGFLIILPPGREVPYHYHEKQESLIFVIGGEATEIVEGEAFPIKAGEVLFIPAKEKHGMVNKSTDDVRYLEFFTAVGSDFIEVTERKS